MSTNVLIQNERLCLQVDAGAFGVRAMLRNVPDGRLWADGSMRHHLVTLSEGGLRLCSERLAEAEVVRDGQGLLLRGRMQTLAVEHRFWFDGEALCEQVTLTNAGDGPPAVEALHIALTLPITNDGGWVDENQWASRWTPIPGRRHPMDITGGYDDLTADMLIERAPDLQFGHEGQGHDGRSRMTRPAEAWVADGWCWSAGGQSLVVLKHATDHYEWSVLSAQRDTPTPSGSRVCFGGVCTVTTATFCDRGKAMLPGDVQALEAGASITFGLSRHEAVEGDWRAGYDAFRRYFDGQGCTPPANFDPPVHWNQLFDMTSFGTAEDWTRDRRQDLFMLDALWEEARKAKEYSCESLYLDPGWDTFLGSHLWDEQRLGPQREVVERLRKDFDLGLSLHSVLAWWSDVSTFPASCLRMDEQGRRVESQLCSGSREWFEIKLERMLKTCENGATFLMFDGTFFTNNCTDSSHGHPVPYTPDAQARIYRSLAAEVHQRYPHVLIELHDAFFSGVCGAIGPKHFPAIGGGAAIELWGNEYMWATCEDLFTGRMKYLDYVNRAYSIPMYMHMFLGGDNAEGLGFWYTASTCRHLGIGGTHASPAVGEAIKGHMRRYRQLKRFFTQGRYYAVDENAHLHLLPDTGEALLLLFNFTDASVKRHERIVFPAEVKMGPVLGTGAVGLGGVSVPEPNVVTVDLMIPPRSVRIIPLLKRDTTAATSLWS